MVCCYAPEVVDHLIYQASAGQSSRAGYIFMYFVYFGMENLAYQGRSARWGRFGSILHPWTSPGESHDGVPCRVPGLELGIGHHGCSAGSSGRFPSSSNLLVFAACGAVLAVRRLDSPFPHRKNVLVRFPPLSAHLPPSRYLLGTLDSTVLHC